MSTYSLFKLNFAAFVGLFFALNFSVQFPLVPFKFLWAILLSAFCIVCLAKNVNCTAAQILMK